MMPNSGLEKVWGKGFIYGDDWKVELNGQETKDIIVVHIRKLFSLNARPMITYLQVSNY